jgi:hypothetical protein
MRRLHPKALLLLVLGMLGCPKPVMVAGDAPEPAKLFEMAQAAHKVPETLSCDAKAFVEAPENGGRYALHISVKRPGSLRIEALTPLGDPAAVLVADRGNFALLDLRNNVFYRGPASPENLSRLIPAPLRAEELAALITGAIPELPGATPGSARRDGDGYRLLLTAGALSQEVALGADLRLGEVRRLGARGELLWSVGLDEHDGGSGAQVPQLIHLDAPGGKTTVDLRLRNLIAGKPPPAGAFQLGVPPGMRVEDVR